MRNQSPPRRLPHQLKLKFIHLLNQLLHQRKKYMLRMVIQHQLRQLPLNPILNLRMLKMTKKESLKKKRK